MRRTAFRSARLLAAALAVFLLVPASHALAKTKKVNLNTATVEELEALPGVGEATAKKIVAGRPYSSVNDLEKAGVPKSTIAKISGKVTASGGAAESTEKASKSSSKSEKATSSKASSSASTAAAAAPAKSAAPAKVEPKAPAAATGATTAAVQPSAHAGKGQVWVNTDSKIYHYEGDRWYGQTKQGQYMSEQAAIKAGYRAAKSGSDEE